MKANKWILVAIPGAPDGVYLYNGPSSGSPVPFRLVKQAVAKAHQANFVELVRADGAIRATRTREANRS